MVTVLAQKKHRVRQAGLAGWRDRKTDTQTDNSIVGLLILTLALPHLPTQPWQTTHPLTCPTQLIPHILPLRPQRGFPPLIPGVLLLLAGLARAVLPAVSAREEEEEEESLAYL